MMMQRSISSACRCCRRRSKESAVIKFRNNFPRVRTFTSTKNDSNSDNDKKDPPKFESIPAPTWSIADLELTKTHPPISQEELDRLSRLSLIRIKENEKEKLNQDLANMLHMVQQVTQFAAAANDYDDVDDNNDDNDDPSCSAHIYDRVRGVTAAPLRNEHNNNEEDAQQAEQVWNSLLRPKTIRKGGGHEYFAIVTEDNSGQGNASSS